MEQLWSISTTIREAERITGFLETALEVNGEQWNAQTQAKFQILLVKNRQYLNDPDNSQIYFYTIISFIFFCFYLLFIFH